MLAGVRIGRARYVRAQFGDKRARVSTITAHRPGVTRGGVRAAMPAPPPSTARVAVGGKLSARHCKPATASPVRGNLRLKERLCSRRPNLKANVRAWAETGGSSSWSRLAVSI